MIALLTSVGKTPVHVKKDVPGFVGNRLQHALWREAIALVAEGICDAETVDTVVKASFGRRLAVLGPLENADLVGTDLTLDIHKSCCRISTARPSPSPYLKALVAEGRLGMKTGRGISQLDRGAERRRCALRVFIASEECFERQHELRAGRTMANMMQGSWRTGIAVTRRSIS